MAIIDRHLREQNGNWQLSLTATGYIFSVRNRAVKAVRHCRRQGGRDGVTVICLDIDLANRLRAGEVDIQALQADLDDIPLQRGMMRSIDGVTWRIASTGLEVR